MREDLRGIAIAFIIMGSVVASAYAFTAVVGPGPSAPLMLGPR